MILFLSPSTVVFFIYNGSVLLFTEKKKKITEKIEKIERREERKSPEEERKKGTVVAEKRERKG